MRIAGDVGDFEFRDPPLEFVVETLLPRQTLLDALELLACFSVRSCWTSIMRRGCAVGPPIILAAPKCSGG